MKERTLKDPPHAEQLRTMLDPRLLDIAARCRAAGGRAQIVGGFVRDLFLGEISKDVDVEVRGLDLQRLETLLAEFGPVKNVGRSFGVLRVAGVDADFSLPRRDSKVGPGHKGIRAEVVPDLDIEEAARRRDLTINAMALDPLDGELLDPLGGLDDLRKGVLRAADPATFGEDPLRALRVVQLAARLEMQPDAQLLLLCHQQDLDELGGERILEELRKLLLRARRPSIGLRLLERTGLLGRFPVLAAMVGVPQDPEWHPEGDVWEHTLLVVDEAATLRSGHPDEEEDDFVLMMAALCHDVGKPATTHDDGQRVRSPAHDSVGERLTREFLRSLRAPKRFTERVCVLVREHLAPAMFHQQESTEKAYRRLARRLARRHVTMELLERLARADHFGRTTPEALAREFPAGEHFLEQARRLAVVDRAPTDVVQGKFLLEHGFTEGPEMGAILDRCRAVQDETGWTDPERILARVLGED